MRFKWAIAAALCLLTSAAFGQGTQFPAGTVWGNDTAAQRAGKTATVTAILDRALGSTRGSILERGASGWAIVGPGATAGLPWVSAGTGADPAYQRLGLVGGGTNADLSATGGASQFLRQNSAGAAITVIRPVCADLSNAAASCSTDATNASNISSGNLNILRFPSIAANTMIANWTAAGAVPIANTIPACANDGGHALVYINGTGLQCEVITVGAGTVTNQTNTASGGLVTSGNCANTGTNAGSPCNYALTSARQTLPVVTAFGSGSGTYNIGVGTLWIEVEMYGGGGGGGGGGTGAPTSGGAGGNTCWNTSGAACTTPVFQAGGGSGGASGTAAAAGGAGGTASGSSTCSIPISGGDGASGGIAISASVAAPGGHGGSSALGGAGGTAFAVAGNAGKNQTGGGGGGGGATNAATQNAGGGGGSGATCKFVINTPAASYTYAVGASGTAGAAGTNGFIGGVGGLGFIRIIEHYGS